MSSSFHATLLHDRYTGIASNKLYAGHGMLLTHTHTHTSIHHASELNSRTCCNTVSLQSRVMVCHYVQLDVIIHGIIKCNCSRAVNGAFSFDTVKYV